jgi:hypothetical protein
MPSSPISIIFFASAAAPVALANSIENKSAVKTAELTKARVSSLLPGSMFSLIINIPPTHTTHSIFPFVKIKPRLRDRAVWAPAASGGIEM